jgi:uncharacterized delta-60 repeat protein
MTAGFLLLLVVASSNGETTHAGSLDGRFGHDGKVMTSIGQGANAYALARARHGKIVVAGTASTASGTEFALARYTATGHLDRPFGHRGVAITRLNGDGRVAAVAVQKDGKTLVAGWSGTASDHAATLIRYRRGGALDRSFGTDGTVRLSLTGHDRLRAIAVEPGGKIVVAGSSNWRFLLARYMSDGALDTSFGNGGVVLSGEHNYEELDALAISPSEKIVAAGDFGFEIYPMDVRRYMPNGSLDPTFGKGGEVITKIGAWDTEPVGIRFRQHGTIVVAAATAGGEVTGGPFWRFGLMRLSESGSVDTSFGTTQPGFTRTAIGSAAYAQSLSVDGRGRLIVAGWTTKAGKDDFALSRYSPDGHLDRSFGRGGRVVTSLTFGPDRGAGLLLEKGGRIVVAGTANQDAVGSQFALAGYRSR